MTCPPLMTIALAALVLTGCTASTPERTSALPAIVNPPVPSEANIFIYTDNKQQTDASETKSRQGYNVPYPVQDHRRLYQ